MLDSGSLIFTKTDNKTYIAGATCVFGKTNFWWIASTDKDMDEGLKKEIHDDFVKQGFKDQNVAKEGKTPVMFKHMRNEPDLCLA